MATEPFIARWKVVDCTLTSSDSDDDAQALQGCEFELTKSGDVFWFPQNSSSQAARNFPLFQCETFEVLRERDGLSIVVNLRFAAYFGHVIEFQVDVKSHRDFIPVEVMTLTYSGLFVLNCQQVKHGRQVRVTSPTQAKPFDLLSVLDEEFFTDMEILSETGKSYKVHRIVVEAAIPSLDWKKEPPPLTGIPDRILSTLLYFIYGQCLPDGISTEVIDHCNDIIKDSLGFEDFAKQGEAFKRKSFLCNKIYSLVRELHGSGEVIIEEIVGSLSQQSHHAEMLIQNPGRLSHVLKQSLKYIAIGFVKLLQLGRIFVVHRNSLDKEEQHEIIDFAKSCLPIFLKQLHRFLTALRKSTDGINLHTRQELAAHFVPELESLTELFNRIGCHLKDLLEAIMSSDTEALSRVSASANVSREQSSPRPTADPTAVRDSFGETGFHFLYDSYQDCNINTFTHKLNGCTKFKSLKNTLQIKDLFNLKMSHRHFIMILSYLVQERDAFVKQGHAGKVRLVSWQIDQLIDELPLFILRLEEFSNMLADRLHFGTFKFCFVVGATLVDNLLIKLHKQKSLLQPFLALLCSLIQSESFNASLVDLDLLDQPGEPTCGIVDPVGAGQADNFLHLVKKLRFDRRACKPPTLEDNRLAQNVAKLLDTKADADMTIVVHEGDSEEFVEVKCHRVILGARCPYFKRALLSGMKEAIERRINVYDTNLAVFNHFLLFTYSGSLDISAMSLDSLSELLLLSDRYDMDSLKEVCEAALEGLVEMDSAITLLSIADNFNAAKLKASCVEFILENEELVESETFRELDEELQKEMRHLVNWGRTADRKTMDETPEGFSKLINLAANLRIRENHYEEIETIPLTHDSSQLEACVAQLRDVLGPLIDQDQLVRVALAADYDVNRALNYFFNAEQA